jgi:hypothetical protein
MHAPETNREAVEAMVLSALAWILSDEARATRLLALTGLEPSDLRTRLGDPALLDAVIAFLEAHQPDLIACAAAITVTPEQLVAAREKLTL